MLTEAGFIDVALRPVGMPMLASVITARKSKIGVNQT
jgi:demethylspheroidene O-methyltransferase